MRNWELEAGRPRGSLRSHYLHVRYGDEPKDIGEILSLDQLTDAEVRQAVRDWMEPCRDRPYAFIVTKAGKCHLVDFDGNFKIVDSAGKTVEAVD